MGGPESMPIGDRLMPPLPTSTGPATSNVRLYLGIGFFASLFCFIFAMLDSNGAIAGITGIASFVCLLLLVGPAGRPPPA
jgi:hypothetical protein